MKKMFLLMLAISLALTSTVFATESEILCEECSEPITKNNIIYNDSNDASCANCGEIISQILLEGIFAGEEQNYNTETNTPIETENGVICPICSTETPFAQAEYDSRGNFVCSVCITNEDEYIEEEATKTSINASAWAMTEVLEANEKNLIPVQMLNANLSTEVTREQFAAIAVKLYEKIVSKAADYSMDDLPFTDCNPYSVYTPYVKAAYKLGITNGVSDTLFSPSLSISREQLATMLYRVIKNAADSGIMQKFTLSSPQTAFADSLEISDYAQESVAFMTQYGIIKGMDESHFVPKGIATKEQAILISNRITNVK